MKLTQEMARAEALRLSALEESYELLEAASQPSCARRPDEVLLDESIKLLMIGSHSGRIG